MPRRADLSQISMIVTAAMCALGVHQVAFVVSGLRGRRLSIPLLIGWTIGRASLAFAAALLRDEWFAPGSAAPQEGRQRQSGDVGGADVRISVQVPTVDEDLDRVVGLIRSLEAQLHAGDEIVLILNNFRNDDRARALGVAVSGSPVRLLVEKQLPGGKGAALNLASTTITHPLIAVVDADFSISDVWLEDIRARANDEWAALQYGARFAPGCSLVGRAAAADQQWHDRHSVPARVGWGEPILQGSLTVVRRSALEAVGGWDETSLTEDSALAHALWRHGLRMRLVAGEWGTGTVPRSFSGLRNQRGRWSYGPVRMLLRLRRVRALRRGDPLRGDFQAFLNIGALPADLASVAIAALTTTASTRKVALAATSMVASALLNLFARLSVKRPGDDDSLFGMSLASALQPTRTAAALSAVAGRPPAWPVRRASSDVWTGVASVGIVCCATGVVLRGGPTASLVVARLLIVLPVIQPWGQRAVWAFVSALEVRRAARGAR